MELIKIKYRKPQQIFEVALYTNKNGEPIELEGKGYKRQKCKLAGQKVLFPIATEDWDEVYACGFLRHGVNYLVSTESRFIIRKGDSITITTPHKRELLS